MNKMHLRIFLFIGVLVLPLISFSQTNDYKVRKCHGYHTDSCMRSENIYYKVHQESRSALFVKGQTSRTPFTIYNGRDYRISLCSAPVLGGPINMKILNADDEAVLYDNSKDEFATSFEFTVTQSADIIIEISVPGTSALIESQKNQGMLLVQKDKEMGCVGVLVEHMITPTKGF